MDFKKSNASPTTITRNCDEIESKTGNIYESIVVCSKRAGQIGLAVKEELTGKIAEFATHNDNLEEIFENREQIEISKYYERLPKPTAVSVQELLEDKIYFRNPEESK